MKPEVQEKLYPIYEISARWLQPRIPDKEYSKWELEGAPEGMISNSTSFYKAFKEEPTNTDLEKVARDWWKAYSDKHKEFSLPVIVIRFEENESWWITWFQHETFDVGQTNEEALASFERYVRRKEIQGKEKHGDSGYLLMGADDRWRWSGSEPDGDPKNRSEPPCRCKFCKAAGLIRIGH